MMRITMCTLQLPVYRLPLEPGGCIFPEVYSLVGIVSEIDKPRRHGLGVCIYTGVGFVVTKTRVFVCT
jgi:hypothetical protein